MAAASADQVRRIKARMGACQKVLAAIHDGKNFAHHCKVQAKSIISILGSVSLTDDQVTELCTEVASIGFPPDLEANVVEKISRCAHLGADDLDDESSLQDYTSMPNYFKGSVWDKAAGQCELGAMNLFISELYALGLRHVSCGTARILCMMVKRIVSGDDNVFLKMSPQEKYEAVRDTKKIIRGRFGKSPEAAVNFVKVLPKRVDEFMELFPSLASHFDSERPVQCLFNPDMMYALAESFPLRKPRGGWANTRHGNVGGPLALIPQAPQAMLPEHQTMFGMMQHLMTQQAAFMKGLIDRNRVPLNDSLGSSLTFNPNRKVGHRLGNGDSLMQRLQEGPPALPPLLEAPPKVAALHDSGECHASLADDESEVEEEEHPAEEEKEPTDMVGAVAEAVVTKPKKKKKKKIHLAEAVADEKKKKKKKVPVADVAADVATSSALTSKKRLFEDLLARSDARKEEAKLKAKEKKAAAAEAKAKAKAEAKAKAAPAPKKDATGDGKGTPAIMKKPEGKPLVLIPGLGCSKCRYATFGCGVCRLKVLASM